MQGAPIAFSNNVHTGNNFATPPIVLGRSRAPESQIYTKNTYGLKFGPNSVYQIPWPMPVYSTTELPNHDRKFVDTAHETIQYLDTSAFKERELVFIGGKVPYSGTIPLFHKDKPRYKFKRPYSKK